VVQQEGQSVAPIGFGPPPRPLRPQPASVTLVRWPQLLFSSFVDALAIRGRLLFIGGNFDSVGGEPRRFLAAVDRTTGKPTTFAPSPDGVVFSIALANHRVYAGTGFRDSGDRPGRYAWAFSESTAARVAWPLQPAGPVQTVAVAGQHVYVGGAVVRCRTNQPCGLASAVTGNVRRFP
jgi:hypothetical protein